MRHRDTGNLDGCSLGAQSVDDRAPRVVARPARRFGIVDNDMAELVSIKRFLRAKLVLQHGDARFGGVGRGRRARLDASSQGVRVGTYVDDDKRHAKLGGKCAKRGALPAQQKRAVDDDRKAARDDRSGELEQAIVGLARFVGRVEPGVESRPAALVGEEPVQPLALDVGAKTDRADTLERARRR
jgi:hypothetical protein